MKINLEKLASTQGVVIHIVGHYQAITVPADGFDRLVAYNGNGQNWQWVLKSFRK